MGNLGGPGTCGNAFGTLCACVAQPPASCVLGSSALLTGRGGGCASGAVGMTVTPLGSPLRVWGPLWHQRGFLS